MRFHGRPITPTSTLHIEANSPFLAGLQRSHKVNPFPTPSDCGQTGSRSSATAFRPTVTLRQPRHFQSPPAQIDAYPSRSPHPSSRTRRDEPVSIRRTNGGEKALGFPHVWRQASSKAHEYVRASAHCVRAMLVVRANGAVESAVQKVFVF